jgi:integrase
MGLLSWRPLNSQGPRLRPAGGEKAVSAIVEEIVASKEKRQKNGQLRYCSVRDFRCRSAYLKKHFAGRTINTLSSVEIKDWLVGLNLSPRSTKNFLNTTAEIVRYAMQRKYVMVDPLADFTDDDRKELCGDEGYYREPTCLSPKEAERLLNTALRESKLELLAYVTLALFCGIRSEELQKLNWDDIKDGKYVEISARIAKKRRVRHVDIPAVAKPWLALCKRTSGPIVDCSYAAFGRRFTALRTRAGFKKWDSNAMRHSFGSYHYALHGNALETARQMGHSQGDEVLFTHYRSLASKDSAQAYFSIKPPAPADNVVQLQSVTAA